jgi:hypothetical protein
MKFHEGNIEALLDPRLEKSEVNLIVAKKIFELAFRCAAPIRHDRPSMKEASEYLWRVRKDHKMPTH